MVTSIQVSEDLLKALKKRKMYSKETYEEVIWDLLEDTMELSEETKKNIEISMKEISEGKYVTWEEVKSKLGMKDV